MRKFISAFIVLASLLAVNEYFRCFPIYFPQLRKQARELIIDQGVRRQAIDDIQRKFPRYDPIAKDRLLKAKIAEYTRLGKASLDSQTQDLYKQLKSRFQDESGQTYLLELDCWHWARYVENVLYKGHPGDEIVNGKQFDTFMLAPTGLEMTWDNFLFYFSAFLYKGFSLFSSVPLFTFLFYLPLFFSAILIVVVFGLSLSLGGLVTAVVSCIIIGLSPNFLPRSCAGWFKKDSLNLLFPLLLIWAYLGAYKTGNKIMRVAWICIAAFWGALFCFTWGYWWFIFVIMVLYECLEIVIHLFLRWRIKQRGPELGEHIVNLALFVGFSCVWIFLLCGLGPFGDIIEKIRGAIILSNPIAQSVWPNVYATVGELKKISFFETVDLSGGVWVFIPAVISMVYLIYYYVVRNKGPQAQRAAALIFSIWFLSMIMACLQGVRFVVFLAVPIGIMLGWALYDACQWCLKKRWFLQTVIALVIVLGELGWVYVDKAEKVSEGIYPLMNGPWYKMLTLLSTSTPPDTIINSWWDFGDWFKVVGKRRVIFDGQSQNKPQAFWMAKAMLTPNETESIGILRMLNNGGEKCYDVINAYVKDPLRSALLLESLMPLDAEHAREKLREYLPGPAVDEVLIDLYSTPGNASFFVDYSMLPKMPAISFLGNWNFAKVYMVKNFNTQEKNEVIDYLVKLGHDPDEMQRYYQEAFLITEKDRDSWISHALQFYGDIVKGHEEGGLVYFENGFVYNRKEKTVCNTSGQYPRSAFIADKEHSSMTEVMYDKPSFVYSILVYETKDGWRAIALDRELGPSVFVRMYFLRGWGLKHFALHIDLNERENYLANYRIVW